uniref:Uncharacterized protein n=1 Tax=Clastoptera arizonana TaxID=38151 RepID=A0A1B6BYH6_9HEMI
MDKFEDESSLLKVKSFDKNIKQSPRGIEISSIEKLNNESVFYDELETPIGKYNEGSDSGVETNGGGVIGADVTPAASCDSSLVSCCYSFEDLVSHTIQLSEENQESLTTGDGTSEGGSESSSVKSYNKHVASNRRKTLLSKTSNSSPLSSNSPVLLRSRTPSTRDRSLTGRTPSSSRNSQNTAKTVHLSRSTSVSNTGIRSRKDQSEIFSKGPNTKSSTLNKKSSPTDDGRWPSTVNKIIQKTRPVQSDKKSSVMSSSFSSIEGKANALEKYATLPRRYRKSAENLSGNEIKSSRDPSLNRTASLRRSKVLNSLSATQPSTKTMPPYPKKLRQNKIRIYHEISVQTVLTSSDLEKGLNGTSLPNVHSRIVTMNREVQVDRVSERLKQLEIKLEESKQQILFLESEKQELTTFCNKLNEEKGFYNALITRVQDLLRCKEKLASSQDVVYQLETEVASTNNLVHKQQQEISQLHAICYSLQNELDKSYTEQKNIIQQQQEVEAESAEMQDFLQAEKATINETLKDLEKELSDQKSLLAKKEIELLKQQEECTHLVRISEQRRQEQLSLEARLSSLNLCSRQALLHQDAAVSGASVALSKLGSRLDNLVHALVTSYNISEEDLEDVIFHNEAYSESDRASSMESSPEHQVHGSVGFMAAFLNAIRSATAIRYSSNTTETSSELEQMLSAEPEPQAFSSKDITTLSSPHDTEKHNSFTSISSFEASSIKLVEDESFARRTNDESEQMNRLTNSESLQNLSLAILRRQELEQDSEEQRKDLVTLSSTLSENSLVDQVIEVDNLITKLLKVVRIIQVVNDTSLLKERQQNLEFVDKLEEQKYTAEETILELSKEIEDLKKKFDSTTDSNIDKITALQGHINVKQNQLTNMSKKACLTKQLKENWSQAMTEVKCQHEAINSVLEVLQGVQSIIQQSPALLKLQSDLQDIQSQCVTNLPISVSPDLNANASLILLPTSTNSINGSA